MTVKNPPAQKRGRIFLMDELRGFAVFCMIFYHGFYTVGYLFGSEVGVYYFHFFMPAEPFFAGLFMFISGISSDLSHSNLKRGFRLLLFALGISLVTWIFLPEDVITFGILHFLAVCMILYGLLKPLSDRYRFSWIPVAVCAVLSLCTKNIVRGYLGPCPQFSVPIPESLYRTNLLAPIGIFNSSFVSADYFPLFPWIFVFAAGTFFGKLAAAGKFPAFAYPPRVPLLSWFGKHALVLYIVHQPIIYGLCLFFQWFTALPGVAALIS